MFAEPSAHAVPPASPPSNAAPRFYHPELDVLRACAFLLVFIAHTLGTGRGHWAPFFHGGIYGVDLFLALSAYLIAELLLRERRSSGKIHVRDFYIRRALRIWPLYFVFLLIVRPLLAPWLTHESFSKGYAASYLFFGGNWACAAWGWPLSIASSLWTVSIEEQFYIVCPLLLRWCGRHVVRLGVGMIVVSTMSQVWLVCIHAPGLAIYCNTFVRLESIAMGILLAAVLHGNSPRISTGLRWWMIAIGAMAMGILGRFGSHGGLPSLFTYPVAALASLLLLLGALRSSTDWHTNRLASIAIYLGRISYGLYVFHLAGLAIATQLHFRRLHAVVGLLITIAISIVSYHALEKPFLRLKRRFTIIPSSPA